MSKFIEQFISQSERRPEEGLPTWLAEFRGAARERLNRIEVPGRKDEEWRFIRLNPLTSMEFLPESDVAGEADEDFVATRLLEEAQKTTLVFFNGRYQEALSQVSDLPEGVVVTNWGSAIAEDQLQVVRDIVGANDYWAEDLFYNLNSANFEDGALVLVPRNTVVEAPIHLLYISSAEQGVFATHPRNVIVAGEGAELTVVEEYSSVGEGAYFTNVVDEIAVGPNGGLKHYKVQRDAEEAFHFARNLITLSQDARYAAVAVNLGSALSRNDSYARYVGQNIDCTLDGLVHIRGSQVSDTHTAIDHALPHSRSYQLHKTIVDERAHSVFNGKIFVRKDAQKTDSFQLNQNLVLSKRAHVDTKPQLEILADDVVCTHGATVGQLEDEQFFYLRSRGIEEEQARALLIYAFAAEVLERITVDSLRDALEKEVLESVVSAAE